METGTWYYAAGEAQHGPFTPDQIRGLLRERKVDRDTFVWSPTLGDWAPLAQTELAALLAPAPPRAPAAPGPAPVGPAPIGPAPVGPEPFGSASAGTTPIASAPYGSAATAPFGSSGPAPRSLGSLTGGKIDRIDLGAMEQGDGFPAVWLRAARTCIQDKFFDFTGRASRPEFWWYQLFAIALLVVAQIFDGLTRKIVGFGVVYYLLALALLLPGLGAAVRRLHDTDRSGWWLLLSLIPLVGGIVVLVFLCLPGTQGDNRFGPPPQRV